MGQVFAHQPDYLTVVLHLMSVAPAAWYNLKGVSIALVGKNPFL